jgi:hypothetical protein
MLRLTLPALAVAVVSTAPLLAQPQPPGGVPQRPTFSPYLNLLNRGASPALNYYGLVRPQQQFQQQAGQLQQQLNSASADFQSLQAQNSLLAGTLINSFLPPTGNVATFNNTGNYFNRIGGGPGGVSFGGVNRGAMGRPGGAHGPRPTGARPAGGNTRTPTGGGLGR